MTLDIDNDDITTLGELVTHDEVEDLIDQMTAGDPDA